MGEWFQFECKRCGYKAEVSGGDDCGMASATTTILCKTRHKLYDVEIEENPATARRRAAPSRCPKSPAHPRQRWNHPGPCPRCSHTMSRCEEPVLHSIGANHTYSD